MPAANRSRIARAALARVRAKATSTAVLSGARQQPQPHRGDDPERALRADQQVLDVVAGDVLADPAAEPGQLARRERDLQAAHPGAGHAVLQRMRAAGVRRDVAADLRLLGGARVRGRTAARSRARAAARCASSRRPPRTSARAPAPARARRAAAPASTPRCPASARRRRPARCHPRGSPAARRARSTSPAPPRPPPRCPAAPPPQRGRRARAGRSRRGCTPSQAAGRARARRRRAGRAPQISPRPFPHSHESRRRPATWLGATPAPSATRLTAARRAPAPDRRTPRQVPLTPAMAVGAKPEREAPPTQQAQDAPGEASFKTLSGEPVNELYTAADLPPGAGTGVRDGPDRPARRLPLHPRHPRLDVPRAPVDDAPVRGLRDERGDQRALPLPARARPDRALDGLRHALADGPRLRPRPLARRGRPRGRRRRHARRHADPLRRHRPRRGLGLDDDQRARRDHARLLRRRGRAGSGPPDRRPSACRGRSRPTSSRSTSPRRSGASRSTPRCACAAT